MLTEYTSDCKSNTKNNKLVNIQNLGLILALNSHQVLILQLGQIRVQQFVTRNSLDIIMQSVLMLFYECGVKLSDSGVVQTC